MARQRGTKWQGDVIVNGVRVRRSFDTKLEAEEFEKNPTAEKPTVGKLFRAGMAYYWKGSKNERNSHRITHELIEFFGSETEPNSLDTSAIRRFVTHLRTEKQNANATINRKLAALSKLISFCEGERAIKDRPKIETFAEPEGRLVFLTLEQQRAIFELLAPRHRRLATFLVYTGCRFGEAQALQWRDVGATTVTFWETKNGGSRTVPMTVEAKLAIEAERGSSRPWSVVYEEVRYDFKRATNHVGLDDVTIHTLRHTCASRLVQRGVDIRRVKDWMGHRSITTTMRYAHLAPNDLVSAAQVLSDTSVTTLDTGVTPVSETESHLEGPNP